MLGQPEVEQGLTAGGSGGIKLTVRNDGGEISAAGAVRLTLPTGISAASITVDGAHAGSGTSCTLPAITPHQSVTVTVTLVVEPDAQDGTARFDVPGSSARVDLTVDRPEPATPPSPSSSTTDQPSGRTEDAPVTVADPNAQSSTPAGS